ncbi:CesD/SycD/LcrH family type III secretion system chaperone [Candidatus Williamhamiltonella defendens]|uniref:CesD/SycD/LcrH family type III secretion system chaperone n=2 Tax=Candidatus Williamhamiltonella defendens TaxID=138072 RepID=A0A2D3TD27_9ENTR|nr:type III secretion system translocator chaperone SicA [Candidatus Hamiltonella defensa]ACQ68134.1 type III secretion chaperone [Candidatus Hamiltonella defensa 5AT (Acyrthosiphon pisum)]ASV33284.1 CesD/SycD/LcrH family type III secretion system chaperone [Candidatus Hamiltonella defensa]ATW22743.1 CesD/SycD/LcrH family type III secretion system chaperone [Candidatus Hamiltonella defensa]ATW29742.1 CesD/SycD/LcrH family type III secretion system chaperone [Candidatus Hamiltonella defensa]ATW
MSVIRDINQKKILEIDDETAEMLSDAIINSASLKDIHNIPEEMMEGLYAYAYDFYQKGKLDEAETFFRFLCMYDLYNSDYFVGLAAVYQLKKQFKKAIDLYAIAFALNKTSDYKIVFLSGQCQLFMGKPRQAKLCFELVYEKIEDQFIRKKAKAYLDTMQKIKSKKTATQEA